MAFKFYDVIIKTIIKKNKDGYLKSVMHLAAIGDKDFVRYNPYLFSPYGFLENHLCFL